MVHLLRLLCGALIGLFRSSARREAEILVLRQQINVLRRKAPKRPALNNADRLLFVWLSRLVPTTLAALAVVRPETVIRWQRAGFRAYWRLRSKILQRGSHALIAEKGCAGFARCPGCWPHSLPTDPGRIAPSIRPDLISGRDKGRWLIGPVRFTRARPRRNAVSPMNLVTACHGISCDESTED